MNVLLTGFTGSLGPAIAEALTGHRLLALVREPSRAPLAPGIEFVVGSLDALPIGGEREIEVIVHAAACTSFRASLEELRRDNVEGTRHLLAFARRCPRLRRFVHLSTICASGLRSGFLPEEPIVKRPEFANSYEQTKWEAERLVLESDLPAEIVRVAIVTGSERNGSVRRPGALHHTLRWLQRGLIPMIPGTPETPVDLVSTEFVGDVVAALLHEPLRAGRIVHAASGARAPRLRDLLNHFATLFAVENRGWARGAIVLPDIVDAKTYALFEDSVARSGDALFRRVCADAQSFLPMLLHPRICATGFVDRLGLAQPHSTDWPALCERVLAWLVATDWGRNLRPTYAHA